MNTRSIVALALAIASAACGASDGGSQDASAFDAAPDDDGRNDAGAAADRDAALPLPEMPQVQSGGGGVIASPSLVPVFYTGDGEQSELESFLGQLASSPYWSQVTSEYGVGALAVKSSVVVTDPAPSTIDDSAIGPWLASKVGNDPSWPAHDPNDVYLLYYPASTLVTFSGGKSCDDFRGYHSHFASSAGDIVYAVKPRCPGQAPWSDFDWMTKGSSHEIVEAVTDPDWDTSAAFEVLDADHAIWSDVVGAEVGDMCDPQPQSIQRLVGSYAVERIWSNASARAGHDPCVPVLSAPYFNVAPIVGSIPMVNPQGAGQIQTLGVKVPVGESVTVPIQFFADGPMPDWNVLATGESLTVSWDSSKGNDGDVRQLTITRTAAGSTDGGSVLTLESISSGAQNYWFLFVSN